MAKWQSISPNRGKSYLAFDVDLLKCQALSLFEKAFGIASAKAKFVVALYKEMLSIVIHDEVRDFSIRFEPELLGDES